MSIATNQRAQNYRHEQFEGVIVPAQLLTKPSEKAAKPQHENIA